MKKTYYELLKELLCEVPEIEEQLKQVEINSIIYIEFDEPKHTWYYKYIWTYHYDTFGAFQHLLIKCDSKWWFLSSKLTYMDDEDFQDFEESHNNIEERHILWYAEKKWLLYKDEFIDLILKLDYLKPFHRQSEELHKQFFEYFKFIQNF